MQWNRNRWWQSRVEQDEVTEAKEQVDFEVDNMPDDSDQYVADQEAEPGTQKGHAHISLAEQIGSAQFKAQNKEVCDAEPNCCLECKERNNSDVSREKENLWVADPIAKELAQNHADKQTQNLPLPEAADRTKRKRKSAGRTNQVMTRLTDTELATLQRRVEKSGLAQGEYLRQAALCGQIVIVEQSVADVGLLDDLGLIRAELGRQGGLLKMIIKPNEGQRELNPAEWTELISWIRCQEKTKQQLSDLERKVLRGDHKTQSQP